MTSRDFYYPFAQVAAAPAWKWFVAVAGGASATIWPEPSLHGAVIASLCLVGADTVLGVYAAWVSGEPIQSSKFRRVLGKLLAYTIVTASLWWGFRAIQLKDLALPAATGAAYLAVATELISILENAAKSGMSVPKWIITMLKGKIKEIKNDSAPDATDDPQQV